MSWARELQREAKERRAAQQTRVWKELADKLKAGFDVGDSVWLYLARVQDGLSLKLAHCWHGPFRIEEKGDEFRYKLRTAGTDYRITPWVHISRLKPRILSPERPSSPPTGVSDEFQLDAALLPEDSWAPEEAAGEFEVESIQDVRWTKATRHSKLRREYLVRWTGYDEPDWVPVERLNCGHLLYEFDQSAKARSRFRAMQHDDGDE